MLLIQLFVLLIITPEWVNQFGDSPAHPSEVYLTGFGMAVVDEETDRAEARRIAVDNATSNLIRSLRVSVESSVHFEEVEDNDEYSQYFSSVTRTSSSLDVQGLNEEVHFEPSEETLYALVYVRRDRLIDYYKDRASQLKEELQELIREAEHHQSRGRTHEALRVYLSTYSIFPKIEEANGIIAAAGTSATDAFRELEDQVEKAMVTRSEIRDNVEELMDRPVRSLEDAGEQLAFLLIEQLDQQNNSGEGEHVIVNPFTYRDTEMGSEFSRYFARMFEPRLTALTSWSTVKPDGAFKPGGRNINAEIAEEAGASYYISGTYWDQSAGYQFMATLNEAGSGAALAHAEIMVNPSVIDGSGFSYRPENYDRAENDLKAISPDQSASRGLNVDVWTSRGASDVILEEDEIIEIFLKVNQPAHIRFIYHLADGNRALMKEVDNHFISREYVNEPYRMPYRFRVAPPFGVEFLQVIVSKEPHDSIPTIDKGDYAILAEDLPEFIEGYRGLVVESGDEETEQTGSGYAETMMTITTLARD